MILSIFKKSQPVSSIIIPLIATTFWVLGWVSNKGLVVVNPMPLYHLTLWIISPLPIWFAGILGLALVFWQIFYFNKLTEKHEIHYRNSYLPALFFLLLCILIPSFTSFNPVLIINIILLHSIDKIFRIYKHPSPYSLIFDACFLIAIASLFYLPAIVFVVFFILSLSLLRPTNVKDWIVALSGFIIPYILVTVWYFITGTLDELWAKFIYTPWSNLWVLEKISFNGSFFTAILILFLMIISLLRLQNNFFKNVIRIRRFHQVLLIFLITGIGTIFLTNSKDPYRFSILIIPIATLISYYFLTINKPWWSEFLFWALTIVILFNFISPIIL